jgi:hypothetical protein
MTVVEAEAVAGVPSADGAVGFVAPLAALRAAD